MKALRRRNKNDPADAAAICEAMGRPGQRFVPVRLIDNQADTSMRHRARELLAGPASRRRSMLCRGHLAEIGLIAPQGAHHAYGLKRMAADGFNGDGEIIVPDCVRGCASSFETWTKANIDPLRMRQGSRRIDRQGLAAGQGGRDRRAVLADHSRQRPGRPPRLSTGHDQRTPAPSPAGLTSNSLPRA